MKLCNRVFYLNAAKHPGKKVADLGFEGRLLRDIGSRILLAVTVIAENKILPTSSPELR